MSPDRLMAMGALIFRSTGLHPDGKKFERNGRATVTLMRPSVGAPWICTHSHISLKPGTPGISHGKRPEKVVSSAQSTRGEAAFSPLAGRVGPRRLRHFAIRLALRINAPAGSPRSGESVDSRAALAPSISNPWRLPCP